MRFTPDKRLIDLLVGQLVYTSPDVAMRELLQNAEDACSLQEIKGAGYESRILVRYSVRENWVEVADNGLGMNVEAVERSFAAVGASKEEVSHIRDLLAQAGNGNRQIANFGVGILSCFGVAESVHVRTKMEGYAGMAFKIPDHHSDFIEVPEVPTDRGTNIRLHLKPGGPMTAVQVPDAVIRYGRHAKHVTLEDADTSTSRSLPESWHGRDLPGALTLEDPDVRSGFIALHPAWDRAGSAPQSELVVCNGGFLVKDREFTLLPPEAIGYAGEIDVKPTALTIRLNREGFIEDEKWQRMRQLLTATYNRLIRARIDQWEAMVSAPPNSDTMSAIEQGVILLLRGPGRGILEPESRDRLARLYPRVVRLKVRSESRPTSIEELLERVGSRKAMYFTREGEAPRQFQQSVQQGSGSVQVTEIARTEDIRAVHLQAKGAVVLTCRPRVYPYMSGSASQSFSVHEADLIAPECDSRGIRFTLVNDAPAEEVELAGAQESGILSELLGLGNTLKLVSLDGLTDGVIRDTSGRLLNCRNPEIREVLACLPQAVGNPIRRTLLQIYMDLQSYSLESARQRTKELLLMPDLADQSQQATGEFLREFLEKKIRPLIDAPPGTP